MAPIQSPLSTAPGASLTPPNTPLHQHLSLTCLADTSSDTACCCNPSSASPPGLRRTRRLPPQQRGEVELLLLPLVLQPVSCVPSILSPLLTLLNPNRLMSLERSLLTWPLDFFSSFRLPTQPGGGPGGSGGLRWRLVGRDTGAAASLTVHWPGGVAGPSPAERGSSLVSLAGSSPVPPEGKQVGWLAGLCAESDSSSSSLSGCYWPHCLLFLDSSSSYSSCLSQPLLLISYAQEFLHLCPLGFSL